MKIKNNPQRVSFKAGLTPTIKKLAAQYSAANIEYLFKQLGVNADFKNNRAIAYCCGIVNDIFETLTNKYKLPFGAKPPSLTVYHDNDLINYADRDCLGFCLPDSARIILGKGVYEARSVFYNNERMKTLSEMDALAEAQHRSGFNSTNHFLHTIIHEWVHNIHNDLLYRVFGYDGTCPKTLQRYNTFNGVYYDPNPYVSGIEHLKRMQASRYTSQQREIIKKEISEYAAGRRVRSGSIQGGNPFELIAETITKEVVDVLDPNTLMVTQNPFYQAGIHDKKLTDLVNNAWYNIAGG